MTLNPLKLTPFQRVIVSLVAGILAGLFFGEPMGKLEILGDVYIKLLQMTVIPYILVSLVGGLGKLDMQMAKRIGSRGGSLILFLWLLTMLSLLSFFFGCLPCCHFYSCPLPIPVGPQPHFLARA
jgi:Na+/H+-dicarboxylate symporter